MEKYFKVKIVIFSFIINFFFFFFLKKLYNFIINNNYLNVLQTLR